MSLDNDIYGRTISMQTTGAYDIYLIGGAIELPLPTGCPLPTAYAKIAIQGKIAQFQAAINDFANAHYDIPTRINLNALYIDADLNGLTNRKAYIAQLFAWLRSVVSYSSTFIVTVSAMTDPATIAAVQIDLSQIATDPAITPIAAVQINS